MGWDRVERWLQGPALTTYGLMRGPASREEIDAAEWEIGVRFPDDLVGLPPRHDGSERGPGALGLAGDYRPMSVTEIRDRWRIDAEAFDRFADGSCVRPPWVMFARTVSVDGLVVDCRPGRTYGRVGFCGESEGIAASIRYAPEEQLRAALPAQGRRLAAEWGWTPTPR